MKFFPILLSILVWSWTAGAADTGYVETNGERIYYESSGFGDPVVFCHGYGGNHAIWFQQVLAFSRDHRVVTWDQRGFGRSTNRAGKASAATFVADLKVLLDHLEIDSAHLVGQSMGGWTIVGFALDHPERVRSLVLSATVGGIFTPETKRAFEAFAARGGEGSSGAETPPPPPLIDFRAAFLQSQIASVSEPPAASIGESIVQSSHPLERVRTLEVPALFVSGERDPIFPPAAIQAAADALPNGRVVQIPLAGHSAYFQQPELWNGIVRSFLLERARPTP